jgi:tetrapyrrole methylase family protein / MazG family protein
MKGRQKPAVQRLPRGRREVLPPLGAQPFRGRGSSLLLAYHLTKKASRVGFDWPDIRGVLKKLDEELKEFREALSLKDKKRIGEELGDILFVMANIARFLRIDPEEALRRTVKKFVSRFHYIETSLRNDGKSFRRTNIFEMDRLWEEAKRKRLK